MSSFMTTPDELLSITELPLPESPHSHRHLSVTHLAWAETFPTWIEAHRAELRNAWQQGGASH